MEITFVIFDNKICVANKVHCEWSDESKKEKLFFYFLKRFFFVYLFSLTDPIHVSYLCGRCFDAHFEKEIDIQYWIDIFHRLNISHVTAIACS